MDPKRQAQIAIDAWKALAAKNRKDPAKPLDAAQLLDLAKDLADLLQIDPDEAQDFVFSLTPDLKPPASIPTSVVASGRLGP